MTYEELKYRQAWTLEQKIDHAAGVVSYFAAKTGGDIFASFSGGKDSTVMLDIIRRFVNKNVPAVFCNTGNEYPEVVKFGMPHQRRPPVMDYSNWKKLSITDKQKRFAWYVNRKAVLNATEWEDYR